MHYKHPNNLFQWKIHNWESWERFQICSVFLYTLFIHLNEVFWMFLSNFMPKINDTVVPWYFVVHTPVSQWVLQPSVLYNENTTNWLALSFCNEIFGFKSLINNPLMFYIIRFEIIGWYWGFYATCTLDELSYIFPGFIFILLFLFIFQCI